MDNWERLSYYGGLCTPHYENVKKFSQYKNKCGKVYDVNSLYPSRMEAELLPYGEGHYFNKPYIKMNNEYKKQFPLYIQDLTIHDLEVKEDKMFWLQVKGNEFFNGREILKNNIDKSKIIYIEHPSYIYVYRRKYIDDYINKVVDICKKKTIMSKRSLLALS